MDMREGYKQTEAGVIPSDWQTQQLGAVSSITTGRKDVNEGNPDGEYPFFTCSRNRAYSDTYSFDTEAILIAGNGDVGNLHYHKGKFEAYQRTYVVSRFELGVPYIWHQLNYRLIESLGIGKIGSSIPYIKKENLSDFEFPLPPTETEQRAIAEALSDVDALISGLDRLIAKKRDLKQAAMQQLLTGQTRLPGFHGEWEVKRLGDVATFFKGRGLPKSAIGEFGSEPCIHYGELFTRYPETIGPIFSRTDQTADTFRSITNDVLMPTSDVTPRGLAKASCIKIDGVILGGDILVIRADGKIVDGSFLSRVIRYEEHQILQLVTGSTVYHLYGSDMTKFTFSMPDRAEQTAIAQVLGDMDAELAVLEARREKTRQLKQGMMQELLTGRTRLV